MNINDFKNLLDGVILDRGLDYYKTGRVLSLEKENNQWQAVVRGSDDYCVIVELAGDGAILTSSCDCSYEYGEYCKHQAAVFYAISNLPRAQRKQSKSNKPDLKAILRAQSTETLAEILFAHAEKDNRIKSELLFRFSKSGEIEERAREMIKASIKSATRKGFVDYGCTDQAVEGAKKVIEIAMGMIGASSALSRVKLLIVALEELMELLNFCDDSRATVGGTIATAIQLLGNVTSEPEDGSDHTAEIFNLISEHALSSAYNGWNDWRIDILEACIPLCGDPVLRERLENHLRSGSFNGYLKEAFQEMQLKIIKDFDGEEMAEAFMEHNLDNNSFRRAIIKKAVSIGKLKYALELCLDGEKQDAIYPGLQESWKEIRYSICERMGDKLSQITLAREFLTAGNFIYFPKLKALHSEEDWPKELDKLLEILKGGIYERVLVAEDLKPMIMERCRQNIWRVPDLYMHLIPDYKNELNPLFLQLIKQRAAFVSDRSGYREVCEIIGCYRRACGEAPVLALVGELFVTYRKRPAFVDELNKVLK
ncbi:MAG: SWIM zinc finger family protein [Clostridiales bacterium]|jgi:hypothetical protein|nr:SWIM zinc finger family protein [Clostridiales bacterium]